MHLLSEKIYLLHEKIKNLEDKGFLSKIEPLLNQLREFIIQENRERVKIGMTEICAQCGKAGKACCGNAIEFKYSDELLMINILLGTKLPDKPELPNMCYFLTSSGCVLFARDAFCINFICDEIKQTIPLEDLKNLRELEGLHLQLQFRLEQILKSIYNYNSLTFFNFHICPK